MKKILKGFAIFVVLTTILSLVVSAEQKYPNSTEKFFVNDFANVISSADEDEIYSRAVALQEKTTAQVAVVTVKSLDGEVAADYALGIGRQWGVGDKEKNNGVVILLAKKEREVYIAVGYGLEGALPDSKTGRIIDTYGYEYLKANDFSKGLLQITKAIINETYIEYGMEPEEDYTPIDEGNDAEYSKKVFSSWVILVFMIIVFLRIFGRRGMGFFFFGGPPGGFGGFGGHGGSFRGGGFSGGGGSFGGGGAGRKF